MDPVTQGVLGGAIGGAAFQARLGRKATAFGALVAMLPDLDVVAGLADPWWYLVFHRGATHALPVLIAAAPVCGWLGYLWDRRRTPLGPWMHLAFWALVTHTLLDACTSYGTQLLWPFSSRRFAWDAVAVIDPAYTLPLALATLLGLTAPRRPKLVSCGCALALVLSTLYLGLGWVQGQKALAQAAVSLARNDFRPTEVRALPTIGNIAVWRIVARAADGSLCLGHESVWAERAGVYRELPWPLHPLVQATVASDQGQTFLWFSSGLVSAELEPQNGDWTVTLTDQRYAPFSDLAAGRFRVRAEYTAEGLLVSWNRVDPGWQLDLRHELNLLWGLAHGETGERRP